MSRSRIPFSQSWDRPPLLPPGGKPIIVQMVVNLELWRFDAALPRSLLPAPHGEPRIPDVPNYSWVEYGLRSGLPRILRLFDSLGVPASASVNALLFQEEPAIGERVVEAGWEMVGHGTEQRALAAGTERETVRDTLDMLEEFSGSRPRGWLGPGLQETFDTPDVLAEAGLDYVLDWAVDDLPAWMDSRHGPLLAVPYNLEINDSLLFGVEGHPSREFAVRVEDTLKTYEQEAGSAPRILTLGLHPHLIGIPHRFVYLRQVLEDLSARTDTVFMTGSAITDWYREEAPPERSSP
ncbi:MAG: polysaccharide deacetylase family protein [bacterium]|nr:polysaccharide deacetylase family protein [bacterium]MDE0287943.1 polysaccharide deacetylase family protein [bacterium]MDE0436982.1 polysaccharide deacetylase family protein [bacterium]